MNEPNPRWHDAIELLLDGASHTVVAERVGCHRNSVRNWLRDPTFRLELARRSDERLAELKLRRAVVTTQMVDQLAAIARQVLDAAERDPRNRRAQRVAMAWLRNYRKAVDLERSDLG